MLAGILITVGIGIIDYKGLKHIADVPKADSIIMLIVLTMTVFVDLLQAVAVGMVLACILFMKKMSDLTEQRSYSRSVGGFVREEAWKDEYEFSEKILNQVYIKHFDGPIFFGFVSKLQEMVTALPDVTVVVMRMSLVPYIDQSGIYAIEDAVLALKERGIIVLITEIQEQPEDMLKSVGLIPNVVAEEHVFGDFLSCIKALETGEIKSGLNKKINWDL